MVFYRLPDGVPVRDIPAGCTAVLGFFDGVHAGHRELFAAAARHGAPVLAWTFFAGDRRDLLTDDKTRLRLLGEAGADFAAVAGFDELRGEDGPSFVKRHLAKFLRVGRTIAGESFRFGKNAAWDAGDLLSLCAGEGIPCEIVPTVKIDGVTVSSSAIRKMIGEGAVRDAARLLLRDHFYSLPVVRGKMLGRRLGFPTANQIIPKNLVAPARGVYVCRASFEENGESRVFPGVLNVGVCPTLTQSELAAFREENPDFDLPDGSIVGMEVMETHVVGYGGDLYGRTLRVGLCERLREEKKFPSLDALVSAIRADEQSALEYFKKTGP